jgi:hypothetical protein
MTREEAIKSLQNIIEYWTYKPTEVEAAKMAIDALRPVSREQVEKMGKGEWEDMREAYNDVPKRRCSRCKRVFIGLDKPFCEACGAPMTDEAVEMVMERLGGATR